MGVLMIPVPGLVVEERGCASNMAQKSFPCTKSISYLEEFFGGQRGGGRSLRLTVFWLTHKPARPSVSVLPQIITPALDNRGGLQRSGVDPPLCSSRACLHGAFPVISLRKL